MKRRRYNLNLKRNKLPGGITAVIIAVVLCVAVGALLGNALGKKAREAAAASVTENTSPSEVYSPTEREKGNKLTVREINARICRFAGASDIPDDKTAYFAEKAKTLADGGASAVSLVIQNEGGELLYASAAETAFRGADTDGRPSLTEVVSALSGNNIYVGAKYTVRFNNRIKYPDAEYRAAAKAVDILVIRELSLAGVGDVVLSGLEVTAENAAEVAEFLHAVKAACPKLPIGVAVLPDALDGKDAPVITNALSAECDYFAVNVSGLVGEDGALGDFLDRATLYFSKYRVRILTPAVDEITDAKIASALSGAGVYDRQEVE